jgi:hypothetical protein
MLAVCGSSSSAILYSTAPHPSASRLSPSYPFRSTANIGGDVQVHALVVEEESVEVGLSTVHQSMFGGNQGRVPSIGKG